MNFLFKDRNNHGSSICVSSFAAAIATKRLHPKLDYANYAGTKHANYAGTKHSDYANYAGTKHSDYANYAGTKHSNESANYAGTKHSNESESRPNLS